MIEFNYQRATYFYVEAGLNLIGANEAQKKNLRFSASIHTVTYNADGMPDGGGCVANYLDGVWSIPE